MVVEGDFLTLDGMTFTGTSPVYLGGQYVVPSGGDYSMDKRGAVHVDGGDSVEVS